MILIYIFKLYSLKMLIKNYEQFLLETIIQASDDFVKILNSMKGDKVADILLKLLPEDIKTNYNFIKLSDEVGKLSFLPDGQATRKMQSGSSKEELFAAAANPTTINRMVKSILSANKIEVSDVSLEAFGNKFKAMMSLYTNAELDIREVKGDEIAKWYLEDNYSQTPRATLHTSCMRYRRCQDYFGIYTENPEKVSLIILLDKEEKLLARALFWRTEQGLYLDRVYFSHPTQNDLLNNWAKLKYGEILSFTSLSGKRLEVEIKNHSFDEYPYIDTFAFLVGKTLQNWEPSGSKRFIILQDTNGEYQDGNRVYSEYEDRYINSDDAMHSSQFGWLSDAVWSDWEEDYIPSDLAIKSVKLGSWINSNNSVKIILEDETEDVVSDDWRELKQDFVLDNISFKWYHKSLKDKLEEIDGRFYMKDKAMLVYIINDKEESELFKKLTGQGDRCTELDKEVFGIKSTQRMVWSIEDAAEIYERCWYKSFVEAIEDADCSQEIKDKKLAEQALFHKRLLKVSDKYQAFNKVVDELGSLEAFYQKWKDHVEENKDLVERLFTRVRQWWSETIQDLIDLDQVIELTENIRDANKMISASTNATLIRYRIQDLLAAITNHLISKASTEDVDLGRAFLYFAP